METNINCSHACRNTCAMLSEALRKETAAVKFYEGLLEECNYPDVSSFVQEIVDKRRDLILHIIQKLNEMRVRSQSIDGVISSYNHPL